MTRSAITEPNDLSLYPETFQKWLRVKRSLKSDTLLIVEGEIFFVALLDDAYKLASALQILVNGEDFGEGFVAALYIPKPTIKLVAKHLRLLNLTYIISYNYE
jgi:hypothetical protein